MVLIYQNRITLLCILFSFGARAQFQGLIVNEFSQGNFGNREYIELLVVGHRTCSDSTANLGGWIFDDQNGWYGTVNAAAGHYRFRNVLNWASVPFGSIILLYNSASGEKNLSIHLADDPTDSNKDYIYILPINSSAYIEQHSTEPDNSSGPFYSYPAAASNSGYAPSTNQWTFQISLNNNGDVISTVSPSKRNQAFFSIAYGYNILPAFQLPTLGIANVAAGNNACLIDENYALPSSWMISAVPANETPGLPNGSANSKWIESMRQQHAAGILTETLTGCGSIFYNGKIYTSSCKIQDTIPSAAGCDSIYHIVNLNISSISVSEIDTCILEDQSYIFNGRLLTTSGRYLDTLSSASGCDSIIRLTLVVQSKEIINLSACDSVTYNNTTYRSSMIVQEKIPSSLTGCDSVLKTINILIYPKPQITGPSDKIICKGTSVTLNAVSTEAVQWLGFGPGNSITVAPPSTTVYPAVATSANGCADTAYTRVLVNDFDLVVFANPNRTIANRNVMLYTKANITYQILSWQPRVLFMNQSSFTQELHTDTSIKVTVTARSNTGCIDSASAIIAVDSLDTGLFIPTAFTPNGDGKNDVFRIPGSKTKTFDLRIYNRWGELIFSTHDQAKGWDGSFAGKPGGTGSYVYTLKAILRNGSVVNKQGTLLLIR